MIFSSFFGSNNKELIPIFKELSMVYEESKEDFDILTTIYGNEDIIKKINNESNKVTIQKRKELIEHLICLNKILWFDFTLCLNELSKKIKEGKSFDIELKTSDIDDILFSLMSKEKMLANKLSIEYNTSKMDKMAADEISGLIEKIFSSHYSFSIKSDTNFSEEDDIEELYSWQCSNLSCLSMTLDDIHRHIITVNELMNKEKYGLFNSMLRACSKTIMLAKTSILEIEDLYKEDGVDSENFILDLDEEKLNDNSRLCYYFDLSDSLVGMKYGANSDFAIGIKEANDIYCEFLYNRLRARKLFDL
ncbi:MAG: hypothetical protein IKP81_01295 [Paludibacteraceae bacterium]|nr:hypothetical protein [Paludibacteraceae bacterium]